MANFYYVQHFAFLELSAFFLLSTIFMISLCHPCFPLSICPTRDMNISIKRIRKLKNLNRVPIVPRLIGKNVGA